MGVKIIEGMILCAKSPFKKEVTIVIVKFEQIAANKQANKP